MAEPVKPRCKVDIEDLLHLALEFTPQGAKEKILDLYQKVTGIAENLETVLNTPSTSGFDTFLRKFDGVLNLIETLTGKNLRGLTIFRNLASILFSGRSSAQSILSIITSLLPGEVQTLLGEAGKFINFVFGAIHFFKNLNPQNLLKQIAGGLLRSVIGRLPGPIGSIFSAILNGTPLGQFLGGGSGGIIGSILGGIFGSSPAPASVKIMDTLAGGFEAPDGIQLSETHIRKTETTQGEEKS